MKTVIFRAAHPDDVPACFVIRGLTRENAVSEDQLNNAGVTRKFWAAGVREGRFSGVVAEAHGQVVGYCFGGMDSGEILVLALLPDFENQGIGKALLQQTMKTLQQNGHHRLFLGCNSDPDVRSYGFYRHLGWKSTGKTDTHGDEILEYLFLR